MVRRQTIWRLQHGLRQINIRLMASCESLKSRLLSSVFYKYCPVQGIWVHQSNGDWQKESHLHLSAWSCKAEHCEVTKGVTAVTPLQAYAPPHTATVLLLDLPLVTDIIDTMPCCCQSVASATDLLLCVDVVWQLQALAACPYSHARQPEAADAASDSGQSNVWKMRQ